MKRLPSSYLAPLLWLIFFVAGAYVLRFGYSQHLFAPPAPGTDQKSILECALALAHGELPHGQYRYSYGYTAFLSLAALLSGGRLWLMRLIQLAVAALIPCVVFRTARMLRCGRGASFAAGLLCCFYAPLVLISLDFLRAAPLALAFALLAHAVAAYFFPMPRKRSRDLRIPAFAAGIFAALCILGRENFLAAAPLPLLFLRRRDAAVFLAAAALPLAAVICFNGWRYGSFQLVPGNAGNILDYYGGSGAGRVAALKNLLAAVPRNFADFCSSYELHNSLSVYAHREVIPFLRLLAVPFPLLLALGTLGAALRCRRGGAFTPIALMALFYMGSMLFFTVFYRFRIPLTPLLAILAAGAAAPLRRLWRQGRRGTLFGIAAALLAFLWIAHTDPDTRRLESERAAVAGVLIANDRFGEAESYLAAMAARGENARPGVRLLLLRMLRAGETGEAERVAARFAALPQSSPAAAAGSSAH